MMNNEIEETPEWLRRRSLQLTAENNRLFWQMSFYRGLFWLLAAGVAVALVFVAIYLEAQ